MAQIFYLSSLPKNRYFWREAEARDNFGEILRCLEFISNKNFSKQGIVVMGPGLKFLTLVVGLDNFFAA